MPIRLQIVTPARSLVDSEAASVVAPGSEGEFGVLPGHEAFLAPLDAGVLRYTAEGAEHRLVLAGGFAEVSSEAVTVLAPDAVLVDEIDREAAQEELRDAEAALAELSGQSPGAELEAARGRVEFARARLAASP